MPLKTHMPYVQIRPVFADLVMAFQCHCADVCVCVHAASKLCAAHTHTHARTHAHTQVLTQVLIQATAKIQNVLAAVYSRFSQGW